MLWLMVGVAVGGWCCGWWVALAPSSMWLLLHMQAPRHSSWNSWFTETSTKPTYQCPQPAACTHCGQCCTCISIAHATHLSSASKEPHFAVAFQPLTRFYFTSKKRWPSLQRATRQSCEQFGNPTSHSFIANPLPPPQRYISSSEG